MRQFRAYCHKDQRFRRQISTDLRRRQRSLIAASGKLKPVIDQYSANVGPELVKELQSELDKLRKK